MARKTTRKTDAKTDMETDGGTSEEVLDGESPILFPEAGPDDSVEVKRLNDRDARWEYVCKLLPQDATQERVAQIKGGGRYRLQLQGPHPETGKPVYKRRVSFEVDGPAHALVLNPGVVTPPPAGTVVTTVPGSETEGPQRVTVDNILSAGILQLFNTMQAVNQTMLQTVKEARAPGPEDSTGKTLVAMLEVVKAAISKPAPEARDPLEMLEKVGNIIKSTSQPGGSFKDLVETMNEVLDLKERAAPAGDSTGDPVLDMIRESLPKVISVVQEEQRRRHLPVMSRDDIAKRVAQQLTTPKAAAALAPGAAVPAASVPETEGTMNPALLAFLTGRRKVWHKAAEKGADPAIVAGYEWAMVDDSYRGVIREFMDREDGFALLTTFAPEVTQYQAWYDEFYGALHQEIFPERYPDSVEGEDDSVEENGPAVVEDPGAGDVGA